MTSFTHILISGASSGIGAALALEYAAPGVILSLGGRNSYRLTMVAEEARAKGATVYTTLVDVSRQSIMGNWLREAEGRAPLDLVIANAGISAGTGKGGETIAQALEIVETNIVGVLHTILGAAQAMKGRGRGQIAIMSSLAGFRGVPGAPAYAASKAAVRVYGEALRCELAPHGVKVNVICPGFVETPMTEVNDFPMPFLMTPEKAARIIRKGLAKNKGRIAFPWRMAALVWLISTLPPGLTDWILCRLPKKS